MLEVPGTDGPILFFRQWSEQDIVEALVHVSNPVEGLAGTVCHKNTVQWEHPHWRPTNCNLKEHYLGKLDKLEESILQKISCTSENHATEKAWLRPVKHVPWKREGEDWGKGLGCRVPSCQCRPYDLDVCHLCGQRGHWHEDSPRAQSRTTHQTESWRQGNRRQPRTSLQSTHATNRWVSHSLRYGWQYNSYYI